jgi:hypothetical protein
MSLNCRYQWAYCSFPRWHVSMDSYSGMTLTGKPKNMSQCHSVHYIPYGLTQTSSQKLATKCLTHGTAIFFSWKWGVSDPSVDACLYASILRIPRWYKFGERRWNDILTGENRRTRRKTCPSATLSTTNPTWIDPGANLGLHGDRLATNDLSHGTAVKIMTMY